MSDEKEMMKKISLIIYFTLICLFANGASFTLATENSTATKEVVNVKDFGATYLWSTISALYFKGTTISNISISASSYALQGNLIYTTDASVDLSEISFRDFTSAN